MLSPAKIPGFLYFISLDRMNSVLFSFNKYKRYFFSFLAAGFCPKKIALPEK